MQILDNRQIRQKIKRLAIQMIENNYTEKELHLVGINSNGLLFAKRIAEELNNYPEIEAIVSNLKINTKHPSKDEVTLDLPISNYKNKVVVIIDDVANTGRTTFYSFKPFLQIMPKKVEVAVLVNRKHKSFPINVDYVGLTLATTLKNNIIVDIEDMDSAQALLE